MASASIQHWITVLEEDLWGRTLPFWMTHSIDAEYGGFFNCLDEDGAVYDTSKHIWLQGRQAWMFAKFANTYTDEQITEFTAKYPASLPPVNAARSKVAVAPVPLTRANLIAAAVAGVTFLRNHAVRESDGHVFFCLSREGKPVAMQRKPFAATFMTIALNEVARATNDSSLRHEALALLDRTLGWIRTPGSLGRESFEGTPDFSPLNVPMILLNVIGELSQNTSQALQGLSPEEDSKFYAAEREWCVEEIIKHVHRGADGRIHSVLENVRPDGSINFDVIDGRVVNPGHAIEAGWFLLDHGNKYKDERARVVALEIIEWAYHYGFDDVAHGGGMLYFKDAEGYTPTQLEWQMKLWWPHNESMIALAMAFRDTLENKYFDMFVTVARWAMDHFSDRYYGEWAGYCSRDGEVTHRWKAGPYKGCFHVPRCLLMSSRLLREADAKLPPSH